MRININKFWNCLKAIANLFDFTVTIKFVDGRIVDFDIKHDVSLMESEVLQIEA